LISKRVQGFLANLGFYSLWFGLAALGVLVAFQIHATLLFIGLRAVENPAVNRMGWNTSTIHGLSRFLYLVLGAIWLVCVSFLDGYLREGREQQRLMARALRLVLVIGVLYGLSYGVLLLLA
jgi:hypothetical protein